MVGIAVCERLVNSIPQTSHVGVAVPEKTGQLGLALCAIFCFLTLFVAGLASALLLVADLASVVAFTAEAGAAAAGAVVVVAAGVAAKEAATKAVEINRAAIFFMEYLSVVEEENLQSLGVILQRPPNTSC